MGLFSRKKKKTPPTVYKAPDGWKRISIGGEAALNVPQNWRVESGEKFRLFDDELDLQAKVTLYQIPEDNNPQLDDVFAGMVSNWEAYFSTEGSIEEGGSFRCIRMNTDEDVQHLMGLSMALIGNYYIVAYIMFTFGSADVYDNNRDTFHGVLSGLGPLI